MKRHKKGLTIRAADQCPMVPKCVKDITETSRTSGLEPKMIRATSAKASRELPTPYSMFSVLYEGKLIADRPVSGTRFWFMMRLPRNLFARIAPMNFKMRKRLIINNPILRFMGRETAKQLDRANEEERVQASPAFGRG